MIYDVGGAFFMSNFKKCIVVLMCAVLLCLTGCKTEKVSDKKVSDIEFTVIGEEDIPETLKTAIDEKKSGSFKLSYADNNDMYLVVGYGEQKTGGFSIVVDELYKTENNIVFATTLQGPASDENVTEALSYPYIVVKMEYIDYEVIYK